MPHIQQQSHDACMYPTVITAARRCSAGHVMPQAQALPQMANSSDKDRQALLVDLEHQHKQLSVPESPPRYHCSCQTTQAPAPYGRSRAGTTKATQEGQ
jgi:hypothetical protein